MMGRDDQLSAAILAALKARPDGMTVASVRRLLREEHGIDRSLDVIRRCLKHLQREGLTRLVREASSGVTPLWARRPQAAPATHSTEARP